MTIRRVLLALGAVAVLAVAAAAAAALLIPSDRIAAAVAARMEDRLSQPVAIGAVELDLFPRPAAALNNLRLGAEDAPVATVEALRVRPRLLPILLGRVVVDEVTVKRPRLALVIDSAGLPNLSFPEAEAAPSAEPGTGRDIEFAVRRLTVEDGVIGYLDERDGTAVRVDGYNQRLALAGALEGGTLARIALQGRIAIDSVSAEAPAALAAPIHGLRMAMDHDAELDLGAGVLRVASVGFEVQELTLTGSGQVSGLAEPVAPRLDLQFATQPFDPIALLRSIPAAANVFPDDGSLPAISGVTTLAAAVRGPLSPDTIPDLVGSLSMESVAVEWRGVALLDGFGGGIDFSLNGVRTDRLEGSLLGAPFRLSFDAQQPSAPVVTFATSGSIPLGRLAELHPLPEGVSLAGRVSFDVAGSIQPLRPDGAELSGSVVFEDVAVAAPDLLQPVSVPGGRLELAGQELRLRDVVVAFGESRMGADATIRSWLPMALRAPDAPLPEASFDVRAATLDLDALLAPSESAYPPILFARLRDRPVDGRSAEALAAEAGLGMPPLPPLAASGRFRAQRLIKNGLSYEDVDVHITMSRDRAEVTRARLGLMGGTVELGALLTPTPAGATISLRYDLTDVGAGPFFDVLTPFRDHLAGSFGLAGTASLEMDSLMLPVRTSLRAAGDVAVREGSLANWDVLRAVGDRLELARFDTLRFNDWSGRYDIVGPLVSLDETVLVGQDMDIRAAGSFDLGGTLDLGATFRLDRSVAERAGTAIRELASAAAGGQGAIPVGVTIRGPVEDVQVGLDLSAARDNLAARARQAAQDEARRIAEQAEREAREQARRAAEEVAERIMPDSVGLPPLDSLEGLSVDSLRALYGDSIAAVLEHALAARADSVRQAIADSIRNRLRRIIPPGPHEP